jgi:competence protein ComEA
VRQRVDRIWGSPPGVFGELVGGRYAGDRSDDDPSPDVLPDPFRVSSRPRPFDDGGRSFRPPSRLAAGRRSRPESPGAAPGASDAADELGDAWAAATALAPDQEALPGGARPQSSRQPANAVFDRADDVWSVNGTPLPDPFQPPSRSLSGLPGHRASGPAADPADWDGTDDAIPSISGRALAALNPGRRAVVALAVVGALIALIAAYAAWHAQPQTMDVGAPAKTPVALPSAGPGVDGGVPADPALGRSPSAAGIVVAVAGRVRHPGLVKLAAGARVADVIAAAGGVLPGTDLSFVNLAAKVLDGQLVVIGVTPPPGAMLGPTGQPADGGTAAGGQIVDINTATVADLDTLPGIGPALAQRIIDYRAQHGAFHSTDELRNVSGIGDAKFAEIKDLVTV